MAQTRQNQLLKVLKQIQLPILLPAQGVAVLMVRNGHIFIYMIFSGQVGVAGLIWNYESEKVSTINSIIRMKMTAQNTISVIMEIILISSAALDFLGIPTGILFDILSRIKI